MTIMAAKPSSSAKDAKTNARSPSPSATAKPSALEATTARQAKALPCHSWTITGVRIQGMDFIQHYESPIGGMTMASDGEALVGLWFDEQKNIPDVHDVAHEERMPPVLGETRRWLDAYFSGRQPGFTPRLVLRGSEFRKAVWEILLGIPYGQTMTYGEIARLVARQRGQSAMSAQAVGGAVGHNPISLVVPCHRVVGAQGNLTGYGGGLWRKQWLLDLEHVRLG